MRDLADDPEPFDPAADAGFVNHDAMAAIEGKPPSRRRITTEPPPLADMEPGNAGDPDVGEMLSK